MADAETQGHGDTGSLGCQVRSVSASPRLRVSQSGFTLIEMLTVILIMAVFASVAIPSYTRFESSARFQKTVQDAAGILAWARDAAIQYSTDVVVQFDPQTETLTSTVEAPAAGTDLPSAMQDAQNQQTQPDPRSLSLGESAMIVDFDAGSGSTSGQSGPVSAMSQSGPQSGITFHEDGSSNGGGFTVISADGHTSVVRIAPPTGRVAISQDGSQ